MNQFSVIEKDQMVAEHSDTLQFLDESLTKEEAMDLLSNVLKELSSYYSKRYFREWEKNHSISKEPYEARKAWLEKLQNQMRETLDELASEDEKIELKGLFSLNQSL